MSMAVYVIGQIMFGLVAVLGVPVRGGEFLLLVSPLSLLSLCVSPGGSSGGSQEACIGVGMGLRVG